MKTTTKASYSLALKTFETAERHAIVDDLVPAIIIAFDRGLGNKPRRLVLLSEEDFMEREADLARFKAAVKRLDDENWELWGKVQAS